MTTARQIDTGAPQDVQDLFDSDDRIVEIRCYDSGWVPNAYKWQAPGEGRRYTKLDDGTIHETTLEYDRKRSGGRGPRMTAFSERGGVLASR